MQTNAFGTAHETIDGRPTELDSAQTKTEPSGPPIQASGETTLQAFFQGCQTTACVFFPESEKAKTQLDKIESVFQPKRATLSTSVQFNAVDVLFAPKGIHNACTYA